MASKRRGGYKTWGKYASESTKISNPVLYVTPEVKLKLDLYIALCKYEISGLGIMKKIGNDFLIEDIYLLEQEVDSTATDIEPIAVAKLMSELAAKDTPMETLKVWFHSHAGMPVFWSPTDDSTINSFKSDYFLSVVGNKKGEYKARLDLYQPVRLTVDNLDFKLYVEKSNESELTKKLQAEIDEKVTHNPIVYSGYRGRKWVKAKEVDGKWVDGYFEDDDSQRTFPTGYGSYYDDKIDDDEVDIDNLYLLPSAVTEEEYLNLPCSVCTTFECHSCETAESIEKGLQK